MQKSHSAPGPVLRPRPAGGPLPDATGPTVPAAGEPLTAADLMSLVRIPLAIAFVATAAHLVPALLIVALAGLSDMLDGWLARRHRPAGDRGPHRGDWLDPLCDKIFVGAVMLGVSLVYRPPLSLAVLVLAREWLQILAMVPLRLAPRLRARRYNFRAHPIGKATTVAQFATALAILFASPLMWPLAIASAALGLVSVAVYVRRAFR
jgi:phosphatidylglycerophosphate synthase